MGCRSEAAWIFLRLRERSWDLVSGEPAGVFGAPTVEHDETFVAGEGLQPRRRVRPHRERRGGVRICSREREPDDGHARELGWAYMSDGVDDVLASFGCPGGGDREVPPGDDGE